MSATAKEWTTDIKESLHVLYMTVRSIKERIDEELHQQESDYQVQAFFDDLTITLEGTQPANNESLDLFEKDADQLLGLEWKDLVVGI